MLPGKQLLEHKLGVRLPQRKFPITMKEEWKWARARQIMSETEEEIINKGMTWDSRNSKYEAGYSYSLQKNLPLCSQS